LAKVLEPIYQKGHHDIEVIRGTYTSTVYRDVDTLDPVAAAALAKEIVNGSLRSS
jgi:hypothetical protein